MNALRAQVAGRTRLAWATGIAGLIAGFAFHAWIAMPPVWLDDLQAVSSCLP